MTCHDPMLDIKANRSPSPTGFPRRVAFSDQRDRDREQRSFTPAPQQQDTLYNNSGRQSPYLGQVFTPRQTRPDRQQNPGNNQSYTYSGGGRQFRGVRRGGFTRRAAMRGGVAPTFAQGGPSQPQSNEFSGQRGHAGRRRAGFMHSSRY